MATGGVDRRNVGGSTQLMVEGEHPARVLALAGSLAALAAERLNQSS